MTSRRNPSNREAGEGSPARAPRVEFEDTTPYDAYVRASTLATLQHVALDALAGALAGWVFALLSLRAADVKLSP